MADDINTKPPIPKAVDAERLGAKYNDSMTVFSAAGDKSMVDYSNKVASTNAAFKVHDKSTRESRDSKMIKHGTPTNEQRFKP